MLLYKYRAPRPHVAGRVVCKDALHVFACGVSGRIRRREDQKRAAETADAVVWGSRPFLLCQLSYTPAMIPTSTNVSVSVSTKLAPTTEAIVVFIAEGGVICGDAPHLLDDTALESVERLIKSRVMRGKAREVAFDLIDVDLARGKARRVFLGGVGKPDKLDPEMVRHAGGAIARAMKKHRIRTVAVVPPVLKKQGHSAAEAIVTGFLLASFEYSEYHGAATRKKRSEDDPQQKQVEMTILCTASSQKQVKPRVERARLIADSQNFARTIAHRPGNDINPPALAKVAV